MANPFRLPMAGQALRNLVSKPATRLYPIEIRPPFPGSRGKIEFDVETCNYCMLCARRCPTLAIKVDREARIWSIDHLNCVACNACVEVCARKSLTMSRQPRRPPQTSSARATSGWWSREATPSSPVIGDLRPRASVHLGRARECPLTALSLILHSNSQHDSAQQSPEL